MQAVSKFARGDAAAAFSELSTLSASSSDTYADQALVSAFLNRSDLRGALGAAQRMVKKSPGEASASETLGRVQLMLKDFAGARASFDRARQISPTGFSATASLAAIDVLEGKTDAARQRLEDSVKADPKSPYPRQALAQLKLRSGAPAAEVAALLDEAITLSPTDVDLRLQRIDLSLQKRQFKEALSLAQDAVAAMPNDTRVLEAVGRAQMESGSVEQAVNTYRRLIGLDPKSVLPYVRLADVYQSAGRLREAEVILKKGLDVQPDLVPAQAALLKLLLRSNQPKEALAYTLRVQRDMPRSDSGYTLEASYHMSAKAPVAALSALRKGLTRNPDSGGLSLELYKLLRQLGQNEESDRFAQAWLKAHPLDVAFEYQTANTHIMRGELTLAEEVLRRVLARHPDHPLALNNMAWVLAVGSKPGAVAFAQRAVDALPDRAAIVDTLAMALASENRTKEALEVQKRAVGLAPKDDNLRLNLARIALQAGDKPLARTELEKLQALGARFELQDEVTRLMKAL
jgi:cellulose synthase operon protein C